MAGDTYSAGGDVKRSLEASRNSRLTTRVEELALDWRYGKSDVTVKHRSIAVIQIYRLLRFATAVIGASGLYHTASGEPRIYGLLL